MIAPSTKELTRLAARIRLRAARMVAIQGFGYLGQALSAGDIYAALFGSGILPAQHQASIVVADADELERYEPRGG